MAKTTGRPDRPRHRRRAGAGRGHLRAAGARGLPRGGGRPERDGAQETRPTICAETDRRAIAIKVDVTDEAAGRGDGRSARSQEFGRLDICRLQRRHPDRRGDRGFPGREVARGDERQPVRLLPGRQACRARHERRSAAARSSRSTPSRARRAATRTRPTPPASSAASA